MKKVRVGSAEGQENDPRTRCGRQDSAASPTGGGVERGWSKGERPSLVLADTALVDQTPYLRAVLRRRGISEVDLDDAVQETVLGAWLSMKAGGFRPFPDQPPAEALRAWLSGVALRQASHYRGRAYRRREVPVLDAEMLVQLVGPSLEQRLTARGLLWGIQKLRPELREVLGRTALGLEMHEIARELGLPQGTVATRLRLARRLFTGGITGRRRGSR